ncbi:MAG: hypothetical protein J2P41_21645 [Blastocatellia bacterium]|nr:hypothetical protein [Blastocatellia bacterium]
MVVDFQAPALPVGELTAKELARMIVACESWNNRHYAPHLRPGSATLVGVTCMDAVRFAEIVNYD